MFAPRICWICTATMALALWALPAAAEHDAWENFFEAAMGEVEAGNWVQADDYLRYALLEAEELGPGTPNLAQTLEVMATVYINLERGDDAEASYKRLLALQEKTYGPEHVYVADALDLYAALLRDGGRGGEAEPLEARAKAIRDN